MSLDLDWAIRAAIGDDPLDMTELLSKYAEQLSQLKKRTDNLYSVLSGIVKSPDLTADTEKFIKWLKEHRGIMDPETIDLDDLEGTEADFYGVDNNCFKLDDTVCEAIEDESDGYRSMLDSVEIIKGNDAKSKIFFGSPVARVVVEHSDDGTDNLYTLVDLHDGHTWLTFGTDEYDYYPCFRFEYTPKAPQTAQE